MYCLLISLYGRLRELVVVEGCTGTPRKAAYLRIVWFFVVVFSFFDGVHSFSNSIVMFGDTQ